MRYAPGSFSKNFGWHDTGLLKLHRSIKKGFADQLKPVERNTWRVASGLRDRSLDLVPINFFLHNRDGRLSVDELVSQAIKHPHGLRFDRLGLFALNLNRAGRGSGVVSRPAMWANEFVREQLWSGGVWHASALLDVPLDAFLRDRMDAQSDVRVKCRNNYRYLFHLCDYFPSALPEINSGAEQWVASALFLAWDRFILDGGAAEQKDLLNLISDSELYKLMGVPEEFLNNHGRSLIDLYLKVGNIARFSSNATVTPTSTLVNIPIPSPKKPSGIPITLPLAPEIKEEVDQDWIDQEESDEVVERRARETYEQVRDRRKAAALKVRYDNTCMFCGVRLQVAEDQFYSEAAHIKPLGMPHNGPDRTSNMLILCPNHHLLFDRGILTINRAGTELRLFSKTPGDPIHNVRIECRHDVGDAYIDWHRNWFKPGR